MAEGGKETRNLYHYTSIDNAKVIKGDGYIKQSTQSAGDAAYGNGVYLTAIPPQSGDMRILTNNYDGLARTNPSVFGERTGAYVKVPAAAVPGAVKVSDARDIYLVPNQDLVLPPGTKYGERKNHGK